MNSTLYLLIVTYFCLLEVQCRSVQLDSDFHSGLEDGKDKDVNHDPESNGRFSWKRLKPILRREVQRIRNVIGETSNVNGESTETTSSVPVNEDGENVGVDKMGEISLKAESQITNTSSIKSELNKHTQDGLPVSELNVPEFSTNMTHLGMLQLDHASIENDFPNNIISDILNQSSGSILLQALNNNSSEIGSLEFDETSLLSEGGHVATLQEVSTVGFELLIDSETKQNLILAELLSSQSNPIDDDDDFDNSTDEDYLSFATIQFNNSNGSQLQEIATDGEPTGNTGIIESDIDEAGSENTELHKDDEAGSENTELHKDDEAGFENTEFDVDDEAGTEDAEFDIDDEIENESIEFGTDEIEIKETEISTGEMKNVTNHGSELLDSVQDESVTEIRTTEIEGPKCPDPGWCVFWFLALDTCAKDSHCHGSLLCCMIGCSKTCIDPENEFR